MNSRLPPAVVQERVTVHVKWFNPTKGFGFVVPEDQAGSDAFLHASVLPPEDANGIAEGATLVCDLAQGDKGLMVATVYSVAARTARPAAPRARLRKVARERSSFSMTPRGLGLSPRIMAGRMSLSLPAFWDGLAFNPWKATNVFVLRHAPAIRGQWPTRLN
jgi:cold shock CspA family protein